MTLSLTLLEKKPPHRHTHNLWTSFPLSEAASFVLHNAIMTERKATRAATAANHPSTLRPSGQQPWHHLRSDTSPSPSSSAQTSDRLTPEDSDSAADYDEETKAGLRRYHEAARSYGGTSSQPAATRSTESGLDDAASYKSDDDDDDGDEERGSGVRRGSSSFRLYTPDEERAVVRKLDRRLVLFMALLYMLSFLDRSSMQSLCRWPFHSHVPFHLS